ncbi:MAG: DUF47 family protein [Spirochaetes bacterium]|nr:DUF47 family protein [Spirochaetota bacterium]
MKLFFGKGKLLEEKIFQYLNSILETRNLFKTTVMHYFEGKLSNKFCDEVLSVHFKEARADDLRRDIEHQMYGKALLPEFRGNILSLLEEIDKLANKCESILFMINLQNLIVPSFLKENFIKLIDINMRSIDESIKLVKTLFQNPKGVTELVKVVDRTESESDHVERDIIKKLFDSRKPDKADKILLKELLLEIGSISDFGERIADMVNIINIKVKV